ncbi:tRNA lysidine(34) synthetase TilS [Tenacibaculum sp. nBUS_03]|uniref:tRNA lysidine(34) synthetase TilS n=1 Tax=Tenacibaculum sp. nBUS_03 TaxID=3395320 RepID=UPI003EB69C03
MIKKFKQHLILNFPFLEGKKILVAISGGVDSVVLTYLLKKLNYNIYLAHCNFQLRGNESDLDEEFIKNLGEKFNLETFTIKFSTQEYQNNNKLSIQLAARELRYNWFYKLLKEQKIDYIVTAHHSNDNLETFIINLTRGTGLEGFTGIPPINGKTIRPLLKFSREEILQYAKLNSIVWREDASNTEIKYTRNKIRHNIIPILKEINPNLINSFNNTSNFLQQSQQIINDTIEQKSLEIISYDGEIKKFDIKKIKELSNPKAYLYYLLKKYGFTEWNDVFNLIYAQTGKLLTTKSHTLLKDRDFLLLLPSNKFTNTENQQVTINSSDLKVSYPVNLLFKNVQETTSLDKNTIYVDKNSLNYPLTLRKWNDGDFFYPKGMLGKKKISKYFKDEKISLIEKQNIWILCSGKNEIIWILGKRQDRRFLPSDNTINILQISIYKPL